MLVHHRVTSSIELIHMYPFNTWLERSTARVEFLAREHNTEGVNGVNRFVTKGKKILVTSDKTRKKLPTSDKNLTEIYRQNRLRLKTLTDSRQSNKILSDNQHLDSPPPIQTLNTVPLALTALVESHHVSSLLQGIG